MYLSVVLTAVLQLLSTRIVAGKCNNYICENIHDLYDEKLDKNWSFVHFQHWYPVGQTNLKENAFENYQNLEYITFKRMLNKVHENSLQGLHKLHTIVFTDNLLYKVPKNLFKGCPVIEKIVIRSCRLQILDKSVFCDIETLTDLKIENNNLNEITKNVFPKNLIDLSLKGNNIAYIEETAFKNLEQLEVLDLSNNYLTSFEFEKYLSNNYNLVNFQISFNYLQNITKLPKLLKLKYLYIDNNTIIKIENNSFQNNPNLEILNLSSNKIQQISTEQFSNAKYTSMNKLYLNYNSLYCIEKTFLDLFPNLRIIWIGANPLICTCYNNMQKYFVNNNIRYPYFFYHEWQNYNTCLKY